MSESDYLLMEIAAIKRGSPAQILPPSIESLSEGFKYFLSSGIGRKLGMSAESVFKELEKFLLISFSNDCSNIPRAQTLEFRASVNNQIVAYVRRYDLESLEAWLRDEIGLKIIETRRIESTTVVDRGLVLVKR